MSLSLLVEVEFHWKRSSLRLNAESDKRSRIAEDLCCQRGMGGLKLHGYFVSSCAWRVRLVLGLKGIPFEYKAVDLLRGEHLTEEFTKLSPLNLVPVLETEDGVLVDSIAILEYLEEKYPEKPLLPKGLAERAYVRQVVNLIASNIQPLQNTRVLDLVEEKLGKEETLSWAQLWIHRGFTALEKILKQTSGKYCFGDEITLADCVLLPQVANADGFNLDMTPFPTILKVKDELYKLPVVQESVPARQPDANP